MKKAEVFVCAKRRIFGAELEANDGVSKCAMPPAAPSECCAFLNFARRGG